MPRSEVAFSIFNFFRQIIKTSHLAVGMDKEHLKEGRDSRRSGYQEI
jgi:hypothetical protein